MGEIRTVGDCIGDNRDCYGELNSKPVPVGEEHSCKN